MSTAAYQRQWHAANKDGVNARRRQRYADDPARLERAAARVPVDRNRAANLRAEYRVMVDGFKNGPCSDCGGRFPPECMDFDHVRGRKLFAIGATGQRRLASVLDEIAKCDLVCSNCHRIRTRARLTVQYVV